MSPLSNYSENTNLTPTNTCVTSWKLDILQFKIICFQLKKPPQTHPKNQTAAILQPSLFPQVLFIHFMVLPHLFQQLCHFSILHMGWYRDQYCSSSWLSAWHVDQNRPSVSLQMMPKLGKMVNAPRRLCNPHPFRFFKTQLDKFHSKLI